MDSFQGTERFALRRRLGSGGFGVVYEAQDRESGAVVALKVLSHKNPTSLYAFKQEFRSLVDIVHPNLATLYELFADGDHWFFTMELVPGRDFLSHVRAESPAERAALSGLRHSETISSGGGFSARNSIPNPLSARDSARDSDSSSDSSSSSSDSDSSNRHSATAMFANTMAAPPEQLSLGSLPTPAALEAPHPPLPIAQPLPFHLGTLYGSLLQLLEGLLALHEAGKVHRDIKPSNILVTPAGRVAILDFGLVSELEEDETRQAQRNPSVVGTPDFMSPEQVLAQKVTPASDLYSVGVMLYEALTGRPPHTGSMVEVMSKKLAQDPHPPHQLNTAIPPELSQLCMALLRRDPNQRPRIGEVLEEIEALRDAAPSLTAHGRPHTSRSRRRDLFFGRTAELALLHEAWVRAGDHSVTVLLHASSGMGKSTLARHFVRALPREAVVLRSSCYQHEAVPYKALDGIVDMLGRFLEQLPQGACRALLPADTPALVKLFPVLQSVTAVRELLGRAPAIADAEQQRRAALTAFRELIAQVAALHPVALHIDDLQWGDLDSVGLLAELLRPPAPPPLLLLLSYRSEEVESSPVLRELRQILQNPLIAACETRELQLKELAASEAAALVKEVMASAGSPEKAAQVVAEARGNPFFITELARTQEASGAVDDLVRRRVQRLPQAAQWLLETVVVAGQPIPKSIARKAAENLKNSGDFASSEQPDDALSEQQALALLRAEHLIRLRSGGRRGDDQLETYHDRIREAVRAGLAPETLATHHRHLAEAMESSARIAPDRLAYHFDGAGLAEKAALYAVRAGEQAERALAFDHAAQMYRLALAQRVLPAKRQHQVEQRLGDAMAALGRGVEAAAAYQAAARGESGEQSLRLRRLAAEQLLRNGKWEQGTELLREVLDDVGVPLRRTSASALINTALLRSRLLLRDLEPPARPASEVSPAVRSRQECLWAATYGLYGYRPLLALELQSRYLLLSLEIGEPSHLGQAFAFEALMRLILTPNRPQIYARLLAQAAEQAERSQKPYSQALVSLLSMGVAQLSGDWALAMKHSEKVLTLLRERCSGVTWEIQMCQTWRLTNQLMLGELVQVEKALPELIGALHERNDTYQIWMAKGVTLPILHLTRGEPAEARKVTEELFAVSSINENMDATVYYAVLGQSWVHLYQHNGVAVLDLHDRYDKLLRRSGLLRMLTFKLTAGFVRANAALRCMPEHRAIPYADRILTKMEHEPLPWSIAFCGLLRASMARRAGRMGEALALLERSEAAFTSASMHFNSALTRFQRGLWIGGDEGQALAKQARVFLDAQGVKQPELLCRMYVP